MNGTYFQNIIIKLHLLVFLRDRFKLFSILYLLENR